MLTHAVVLGGLGQAGSLLSRSLGQYGVHVTLVDSGPRRFESGNSTAFLQADVATRGPNLEAAIQQADCVCVCLPEATALKAAPWLTAAMTERTLWVDTLSVKTDITRALESSGRRLEILSINPMFAPALGWKGRPVAVVELSSGPKTAFFLQLLNECGARVEAVTADEHDALTAVVQVATHAAVLSFGAALLHLKPDLVKLLRLATPPHRLLLTLLYRMTTQNPQVYWDIQAHHPSGAEVRQVLEQALSGIDAAVESGHIRNFESALADLKTLLEPHESVLSDLWGRLMDQLDLRNA